VPAFGPIKRQELIRCLKECEFEGPYSGGKHQYMVRGSLKVRLPNPHQSDISRNLLIRILKQADISRAVWEQL
jgi:hypothetical protein